MSDFDQFEKELGQAPSQGSAFDEIERELGDAPPAKISFDQKREILRRAYQSNQTWRVTGYDRHPDTPRQPEGGFGAQADVRDTPIFGNTVDLDYSGGGDEYRQQVDDEFRHLMAAAGLSPDLSDEQARRLIDEYEFKEPEADWADKVSVIAGEVNKGALAPLFEGYPALLGKLGGDRGAAFAEEFVGPGREILSGQSHMGTERYDRAVRSLQESTAGRVAMAGANLVGMTASLKASPGMRGVSQAAGSALSTPASLAAWEAVSGRGAEAAGGAALFGQLAHSISAPLQRYLAKLPQVERSYAMQQLAGRGTGAVSFAAAGEMIAGLEGEELLERERLLSNAIFGTAMAGRLKPDAAAARGRADARAKAMEADMLAQISKQMRSRAEARTAPEMQGPKGSMLQPGRALQRAHEANLTEAEAGRAKIEAVERGARDIETGEKVRVDPREVVSEGRVETLRSEGPEALKAKAPEKTDGGKNVEAGFKPIEQARKEGLIHPDAEPAVRKLEKAGVEPFNSHIDPKTGEASALGITKSGEVVRARVRNEKIVRERPTMTPAMKALREAVKRGAQPEEIQRLRNDLVKEQGGFADVGAIAEPVAGVAKSAARGVGGELGSVMNTVARSGPAGRATREKLRQVETAMFEERAAVRKQFEAAETAAASRKNRDAFTSLAAERMEPGKKYGYSALELKAEGAVEATAAERKIIDPLMEFVHERGVRAEAAGVPGFKNRRGILPRVSTSEMHRVLREGTEGKDWRAVESALADHLPGGRDAAREWMLEAKEVLDSEGGPAMDRKAQFEFRREIPRFPAFVQSQGKTLQLLQTDPAKILRSLHERGSARLAFGRVMGWPEKGAEPRQLAQLREKFLQEGGDAALFSGTMRVAQGGPFEPPRGVMDAEAAAPTRGAKAISTFVKSTVLSAAHKAAWTEAAGPITTVTGAGRTAKAYGEALVEAARERFGGGEPSARTERLRDLGLMERFVRQANVDPNRHVSGAIDRASELVREWGLIGPASRVANDRVAAYAVDAWVRDVLMKGKGERQAQRNLRVFGEYSRADAKRLAEGKGTEAEYGEATRRVVGNMVGSSGLTGLGQSRLQHRQWFRLFPFTQYATTQLRTEGRQLRDLAKSLSRVGSEPAEAAAGVYGYARHLVGRGAQSVLWQALGHILAGGDIEQFAKRWQHNPGGEALAAITTAMLAGSYGQIALGFMKEGGVGAAVQRGVWLAALIWELKEIAAGNGRYEGRTLGEKAVTAMKRWAPMTRDAIALVEMSGLAGEDAKQANDLRIAMRDFSRFRHGAFPRGWSPPPEYGKRLTAEEEESRAEFKEAMLRGSRAIKSFAPKDEVLAELQKAMRAKDASAVRRSLLQRRILATNKDPLGQLSKEERRLFKSALTEKNRKVLMAYDRRLETIADWVSQPKARSSTRTNGRRRKRR